MSKFTYRLFVYYMILCVLTFTLTAHRNAYSQALAAPVGNFVMNRAIASSMLRITAQRGFAANDPRIEATLLGMKNTATQANVAATVGTVALAIAGAPLWLTIAFAVGVIGVGTYILTDKNKVEVVETEQGTRLKVTPLDPPGLPADYPLRTNPYGAASGQPDDAAMRVSRLVLSGIRVFKTGSCYSTDKYCSWLPPVPDTATRYYSFTVSDFSFVPFTSTLYGKSNIVMIAYTLPEAERIYDVMSVEGNTNASSCAPSNAVTGSYCLVPLFPAWNTPLGFEYAPDGTTRLAGGRTGSLIVVLGYKEGGFPINHGGNPYQFTYIPPAQVYANAPPAKFHPQISGGTNPLTTSPSVNDTLSPVVIRDIVNKLWESAAAAPEYTGLPYSPVTATEVQQWAQTNPQAVPRLNDLLQPASNPYQREVPISDKAYPVSSPNANPNPSASTGSNANPATGPLDVNVINVPHVEVDKIDLGDDPQTPAPILEDAPTADSILRPIFDWAASMGKYTTPSHASDCYRPAFDLFGKSVVMSAQCDIAEQNRSTIQATMFAVWLIVAAFIVLRA